MPDLAPEQRARQQIDAQLAASGWVVQNYKQFNASAGHGIALGNEPLKSGICDYLLLVDRQVVGVVEAKKEGTHQSGIAEQSGHYGVIGRLMVRTSRRSRRRKVLVVVRRPIAFVSNSTRSSSGRMRSRGPTWPYPA